MTANAYITYRDCTITREPAGDLLDEGHEQHSTHVNPLGRRNHASLAAAKAYIDSVLEHPDVVRARRGA